MVHAGGGCQPLLAVVRFTPLPSCVLCIGGGVTGLCTSHVLGHVAIMFILFTQVK